MGGSSHIFTCWNSPLPLAVGAVQNDLAVGRFDLHGFDHRGGCTVCLVPALAGKTRTPPGPLDVGPRGFPASARRTPSKAVGRPGPASGHAVLAALA